MKQINKQLTLHYHRYNGNYQGWGLHLWGEHVDQTQWLHPVRPSGQDQFGLLWQLALDENADEVNFVFHRGDTKDAAGDQTVEVRKTPTEIWLVEGGKKQFSSLTDAIDSLAFQRVIAEFQQTARAHWISATTLAVPPQEASLDYSLHFDPQGRLRWTPSGLVGGQQISLEYVSHGLQDENTRRFPHLAHFIQLKIPILGQLQLEKALKGQLLVAGHSVDASWFTATAVQTSGVLDDLYAYQGPLGVTFDGATPTIRVWAPTAREVLLYLYDPHADQGTMPGIKVPMTWEPDSGTWLISGVPEWKGDQYAFEVTVYDRYRGRFITNLVTDPYSKGVSLNSNRSLILDIDDQSLKPGGWDELVKTQPDHPSDIILYELHLRDFSGVDPSIPESEQGTFTAFTHVESPGMLHLKRLAEAGVSHIHLMPVSDFGTVNDDRSTWKHADFNILSGYPPESNIQQALVDQFKDMDGYNWGYDPLHYQCPEGSYATEPDGPGRILEFRRMVAALDKIGLKVVMDMVFNHTYTPTLADPTLLEKIVPGYYQRLDENGDLMTSTCCPDTASENAMMEKLLVDTIVLWARAYKVDGFRFDLMGHHLMRNLYRVREALKGLSVEKDGVEGGKLYLYGEGWDFGGLAHNARGINASQQNIFGSGVGAFNDRLRDALRGGGPFDGFQDQGYATGLASHTKQMDALASQTQRERLLSKTDIIRLGLVGNLADYILIDHHGRQVRGAEIDYNGASAGFARDPAETVAYISAHDNETWFDAVQIKVPLDMPLEERIQLHKLGLGIIALAQGVPFFSAGDEILRSKSMDRNSFNSGDWFNHLDFSYQTNNWGIGLPLKGENGANWPVIQRLLARPELKADQGQMLSTMAYFEEMLRIRRSSPLFRLHSGDEIVRQVSFHNTGPDQVSGLIIMRIGDSLDRPKDPLYRSLLVAINASSDEITWPVAGGLLPSPDYKLHPIQENSSDNHYRTGRYDAPAQVFYLPGRSILVFTDPRD